jgi:hypothetical protein
MSWDGQVVVGAEQREERDDWTWDDETLLLLLDEGSKSWVAASSFDEHAASSGLASRAARKAEHWLEMPEEGM